MPSPISAKERVVPVSLVEGTTVAARRLLEAVAAANSAPALSTDGVPTMGASHLHLLVKILVATQATGWLLWLYDRNAEEWYLDTRLGTAGLVSLVETDGDHPQGKIIEIAGVSRIYVELRTVAAGGVNVWASANTYL